MQRRGFSLVEAALVMIIIGALTAGIIKGSEMVSHSKLITFAHTLHGIKASTLSFHNNYKCLPGDFNGAAALGMGTSGNCDGKISSSEASNFWDHLEDLYPLSVKGSISGATLSPHAWNRNNFKLDIVAHSDGTSWNGILRGNNIESSSDFRISEARFIDNKINDGSPFSGNMISDNDECVDHEESGTKPTFTANHFGSGTGNEGDKDACMTRLIINRWFGRDMGLTTINSGGGGGCASCDPWASLNLGTLVTCPNWGGLRNYKNANFPAPLLCNYTVFVGWMDDPLNYWNISGCGYKISVATANANHTYGTWISLCAPCNSNADCPSGFETIGLQTKTWNSAYQTCWDSTGATNSGNAGYCAANHLDAQSCSQMCTTP